MKGARLVLGLSLCGQALAEVPTLPIKAASMSNKRGLPRRPAAQGTNHGVGALAVSTTTTAAVLSARPALSLATAARGGGGAVLAASGSGVINGFLLAMVCGTAWAYLKHAGGLGGSVSNADAAQYAEGLFYSGIALLGNTGVSSMRKVLARHVGNAQQVGLATGIQGFAALAYCLATGALNTPPPSSFWGAAVASSCLNALVKTLETKAFAESDMSLCAPFLAFDPVMQFVVGTCVVPLTCAWFAMGCAELKNEIPLYHVLAVATVASGAFALGRAGSKAPSGKAVTYVGPLPLGSWLILFNCFVYGFTFRLDRSAVQAGGKTVYYMYGRLIMAATTLGGSGAAGGLTKAKLRPFATPKVAALLALVCCLDAVYMLSLYKAVTLISPVYVAAIKRGGGVLVSSLIGVSFFGESVAGRVPPILAIAAGVVLLCMK